MLLVCIVMRGFYPNNWRLSPVRDRPDWTTSPAQAFLAFLSPILPLGVISLNKDLLDMHVAAIERMGLP